MKPTHPFGHNKTTDMDYEKKYNEALERARALWREAIEKEYVEDYLKDYETIFPELRESEKPVPKDLDFEQELYNHFGQIRDFTLGMRIGQYFYNLGRDSVPLPEDTVLFQKGVEEGKRLMREDYPKWYKVQRGSCFDKYTNFILSAREGHFYCSSMEVPRDGYILLVDELERLPKEDEK